MTLIIIPCRDNSRSSPPSVRQLGTSRALGREVFEWAFVGDYHHGGAGFFGLGLLAGNDAPTEWLVLTLWGAGTWLLLDGRWIQAHPDFYSIQQPLFSNFYGEGWDHVTERVVGTRITSMSIEDHSSRVVLTGHVDHVLDVPKDTQLLPYSYVPRKPKVWPEAESQLDAWVYSCSKEVSVLV